MSKKRLIDANALEQVLFKRSEELAEENEQKLSGALRGAICFICQAPTVPAEIVCRCKDCVHSQYDALLGGYWCNGKNHSGLWFCADGERRESEAGK